MVSMAELHPDMQPNPHSHDLEQVFMLLRGKVKLHVGDQLFDMEAGSIVRIPPNVTHYSEPPRPEDGFALNLDVFAAIRDDHRPLIAYQTDRFDDIAAAGNEGGNGAGHMPKGAVPVYNWWRDIPARESRKGIIQRDFRGSDLLIGCSELHPHMDGNPHSHEYEQIFMILEGRVRLHVGDDVQVVEEGGVVRIPPHVEHWSEPPTPEDGVAINLDIWTPYRPDFGAFTAYQTDDFGLRHA
jgi:mannose-6-phosphate isomerase-like protein (cupin superfamily)